MSKQSADDYIEPYAEDHPVYKAVMAFRDEFLKSKHYSGSVEEIDNLSCADGERLAWKFANYVTPKLSPEMAEEADKDGELWSNVLRMQ